MNWAVHEGAEMILLPRFQIDDLLKTIAAKKPTAMPGVPTLFNAILNAPDLARIRSEIAEILHFRRRTPAEYAQCCLRAGNRRAAARRLWPQRDVAGDVLQPRGGRGQGRLHRAALSADRDPHRLGRPAAPCAGAGRDRGDLRHRPPGDGRLLEAARRNGKCDGRRHVRHRRRRPYRRRRLCLHHRSHQGHDQRQRLQDLSAQYRGGDPAQ